MMLFEEEMHIKNMIDMTRRKSIQLLCESVGRQNNFTECDKSTEASQNAAMLLFVAVLSTLCLLLCILFEK